MIELKRNLEFHCSVNVSLRLVVTMMFAGCPVGYVKTSQWFNNDNTFIIEYLTVDYFKIFYFKTNVLRNSPPLLCDRNHNFHRHTT